ncbi:MAG: endonuclease III [Candidatus Altiarchaeota archaeon]|nr:endonuclease III [Candidatus Altiarchaeota archaeon]
MKTNLQGRADEIFKRLEKKYPQAKIALHFGEPIQLLVATILSAQCTDKRVNIVTKDLFRKYQTARDYANADIKVFEQEIRSTGFYHNKAKNIIGAAKMIVEEYSGKVPDTMEELVKLPGVARKTANIVLSSGFGRNEGIAVDTHVRRLSGRLGLSKYDDPPKIEQDLMKLYPREDWALVSYLIIDHGRAICNARKPLCSQCFLNDICPSANIFMSKP